MCLTANALLHKTALVCLACYHPQESKTKIQHWPSLKHNSIFGRSLSSPAAHFEEKYANVWLLQTLALEKILIGLAGKTGNVRIHFQ